MGQLLIAKKSEWKQFLYQAVNMIFVLLSWTPWSMGADSLLEPLVDLRGTAGFGA